MESSFTIAFEPPYWVGILERRDDQGYWVGRHVFGSEPTSAELWEFARGDFAAMRIFLAESSNALAPTATVRAKSRKRTQREARREQVRGLSSYTHQALQQQWQEQKEQRKLVKRNVQEHREEELFAKRVEKRKQKHRGR